LGKSRKDNWGNIPSDPLAYKKKRSWKEKRVWAVAFFRIGGTDVGGIGCRVRGRRNGGKEICQVVGTAAEVSDDLGEERANETGSAG